MVDPRGIAASRLFAVFIDEYRRLALAAKAFRHFVARKSTTSILARRVVWIPR
jgi:hypothetical protein